MANPLSGYNALGHALAGGNAPNAALMEAQGEYLGANTANAIAEANARIARNKALADPALADKLTALAGGNPQLGAALHQLLQAGVVNPENILKAVGENQRNAAGVTILAPGSSDQELARALMLRDPNAPGLVRPTANGEAATNIAHPEQGVVTTPLGNTLAPAVAAEHNAHAALFENEAEHPEKYHFPPVGGAPLDAPHQQKLQELYDNGVLDPSKVTRYNATPAMIDAASDALHSGNFNPGLHASATLQKQEADFSGEGKNGQRLRAGNALSSHIKMLGALADAQDSSDLPTAQKVFTTLTGQAGSDFPTMNKLASHFVGSEMDSFLASGNSTLEGRQEAQNHFNQNDIGGSQLRANVNLGRKLMGGQYAALKQTYASAPGRTADDVAGFADRFLPANRDILDDYEKANGVIKPSGKRPAPSASTPTPGAVAPAAAPGGGDPLGILGSQ